jgi:hypothetical protein
MTERGEEKADDANANKDDNEDGAKADGTPDAHDAVVASWGYPAFARGFPRHAELDSLVEAFANGDYLTVRTRAPKLAASPDVPVEVKRAAELLRARVEPDKTARTFFALAAALLVFLTVWWVTHDGPEHHGPAPAPVPPKVEFVK